MSFSIGRTGTRCVYQAALALARGCGRSHNIFRWIPLEGSHCTSSAAFNQCSLRHLATQQHQQHDDHHQAQYSAQQQQQHRQHENDILMRKISCRLLTEPWQSIKEWHEACQILDWWIPQAESSPHIWKLLRRMNDEGLMLDEQDGTKEPKLALGEFLNTNDRLHAMIDRWALDSTYKNNNTNNKDDMGKDHTKRDISFVDASEVTALLDSLRLNHDIRVDASLYDIVHRVTARQKESLHPRQQEKQQHHRQQHEEESRVQKILGPDNLLPVLTDLLAEREGNIMHCPRFEEIDAVLREGVRDAIRPVGEWAQNVLDTLWLIHKKNNWPHIQPDHSIYQSVLRAWLKSNHPAKSVHMKRLLDEMETLSYAGTKFLFPGRIHYTLLFSAYGDEGNAEKALELLDHLESRHETTGMKKYEPSGQEYGAYMAALSRSDDANVVEKAEKLLKHVMRLYHENNEQKSRLPRYAFWTSYFEIVTRVTTVERLEQNQSLLWEICTDNGKVKPNKHHYGVFIRAWGRLGHPERAEELLNCMIDQYEDGFLDARPDAKTILDVVQAWSESSSEEASKRIRNLKTILSRLQKNHSRNRFTKQNLIATNDSDDTDFDVDLLKMLSKAADQGDAARADQLLQENISQCEQGEIGSKITREHYQAVITAWSKTPGNESCQRADSLLREMLKKYDEGNANLKPQEHGFTAAIATWARSRNAHCGHRAQELFDEMVRRFKNGEASLQPTVRSYSALIKAWASQGEPRRAEFILHQMHEDYLQGNRAAQPNVTSFNTVLSAWSKDTSDEALNRATQTLRLMQDLRFFELEVTPDVVSFASTIACCIKSKAQWRVELAESLLQECRKSFFEGSVDCRPNCMLYGAVIQTIARSGEVGAGERCEAYLREMLTLADFDPRQVVLSHTATMAAWAKESDKTMALARAKRLVDNLVEISRERQNKRCLPTAHTFAQYLSIISRSSKIDKASVARATLDQMRQLGVDTDDALMRLVRFCLRD